GDHDAGVPVAVRDGGARETFDAAAVGVFVLAGGGDLRQGDGAGADDDAVLRLQVAARVLDRGTLLQRDVQAIDERQRLRDGTGVVGLRAGVSVDGQAER